MQAVGAKNDVTVVITSITITRTYLYFKNARNTEFYTPEPRKSKSGFTQTQYRAISWTVCFPHQNTPGEADDI